MKVFHYTQLDDWRGIERGSWKSRDIPGLGASRRMGQHDAEAWETGAVFALLEAQPSKWVANPDFKQIWDWFRVSVGPMLLEIETDPEKDSAYVVDRGHIEGFLYDQKDGIPAKYLHKTQKEAERAYMESKIPLKDYLKSAEIEGYSLPEVVFTEGVPLEKISISEKQPYIEEMLERYKGDLKEGTIAEIKRIPGLAPWYREYEHQRNLEEGKEISLGIG